MNALVTVPVAVTPDEPRIHVIDAGARLYAVPSRTPGKGTWHVVRPLTALDWACRGEQPTADPGDLACTSCEAALTGKACWALAAVEDLEAALRWQPHEVMGLPVEEQRELFVSMGAPR